MHSARRPAGPYLRGTPGELIPGRLAGRPALCMNNGRREGDSNPLRRVCSGGFGRKDKEMFVVAAYRSPPYGKGCSPPPPGPWPGGALKKQDVFSRRVPPGPGAGGPKRRGRRRTVWSCPAPADARGSLVPRTPAVPKSKEGDWLTRARSRRPRQPDIGFILSLRGIMFPPSLFKTHRSKSPHILCIDSQIPSIQRIPFAQQISPPRRRRSAHRSSAIPLHHYSELCLCRVVLYTASADRRPSTQPRAVASLFGPQVCRCSAMACRTPPQHVCARRSLPPHCTASPY